MKTTFAFLLEDLKTSARWQTLAESSRITYENCVKNIASKGLNVEYDMDDWESIWMAINNSKLTSGARVMTLRIMKVLWSHYAIRYGIELHSSMTRINKFRIEHVARKTVPLTKREEQCIWEATQSHENSKVQALGAICRILFWTGMRPSELLDLKWENVSDDYIEIIGGKRRFEKELNRIVRITKECREGLAHFYKEKGLYVVTHRGIHMSYQTIMNQWKYIFDIAGVERHNIYACRHGLGTAMFNAGYDVAAISGQLGHKNICTTMRYISPTKLDVANRFKGDI